MVAGTEAPETLGAPSASRGAERPVALLQPKSNLKPLSRLARPNT
jgi:hypothetical protein